MVHINFFFLGKTDPSQNLWMVHIYDPNMFTKCIYEAKQHSQDWNSGEVEIVAGMIWEILVAPFRFQGKIFFLLLIIFEERFIL